MIMGERINACWSVFQMVLYATLGFQEVEIRVPQEHCISIKLLLLLLSSSL
jgi:hypothetical protein